MQRYLRGNFFITIALILSLFLIAAHTPIVVSAVTDAGGASGSVDSNDDEDEDELPPCEIIEWSDGGGSFSCVDDSMACENTTGGGSCVATQLNAVLNSGGTLNITRSNGKTNEITLKNVSDLSSGLSLDITNLNLPESKPDSGLSWLPFPEVGGGDISLVEQAVTDPFGLLWDISGLSSDEPEEGEGLNFTENPGLQPGVSFSGFNNDLTVSGSGIVNPLPTVDIFQGVSILPALDPLGIFGDVGEVQEFLQVNPGLQGAQTAVQFAGISTEGLEKALETGISIAQNFAGTFFGDTMEDALRKSAVTTMGLIKDVSADTPIETVVSVAMDSWSEIVRDGAQQTDVVIGNSEDGNSVVVEDDEGVRIYDHGLTLGLELKKYQDLLAEQGKTSRIPGGDPRNGLVVEGEPEGFSAEQNRVLEISRQYGVDRDNHAEVAAALQFFEAAKSDSADPSSDDYGKNPEDLYKERMNLIADNGGGDAFSRVVTDLQTGQSTVEACLLIICQNITDKVREGINDAIKQSLEEKQNSGLLLTEEEKVQWARIQRGEEPLGPQQMSQALAERAGAIGALFEASDVPLYSLTDEEKADLLGITQEELNEIQTIKDNGVTVTVPSSLIREITRVVPTFEERYGPYGYLFHENPDEKGLVEIVREWGSARLDEVIGQIAGRGTASDTLREFLTTTQEQLYGDEQEEAVVEQSGVAEIVECPTGQSLGERGIFLAAAAASENQGVRGSIEWNGRDVNLEPSVRVAVEQIQSVLPFDLVINSGHRTEEHNASVGGATNSRHIHGDALDISISGLSDSQKTALVAAARVAGVERIIGYSGNSAIHIDMAEGYGDGSDIYPMWDRSNSNMHRAHDWFTNGLGADIAGIGGEVLQSIADGQSSGCVSVTPTVRGSGSSLFGGSRGTGGVGGRGGGSGTGENSGGKGGSSEQQAPRFSCSPNSVINGADERVKIKWSCPESVSASGIGFSTNGAPSGNLDVIISETDASFISYGLRCSSNTVLSCRINIVSPSQATF